MVITVLWYILIFLGCLLLLLTSILLALIIIPYKYQISGENLEKPLLEGQVSWLFGEIKVGFCYDFPNKVTVTPTIFGIRLQSAVKDNIHQAKKEKKRNNIPKDKARHSRKPDFRQFLNKALLREAWNAISGTLRHISPRILFIDARIGLYDPMLNGLLSAFNNQFNKFVNHHNIHLQPVFEEETIKGRFLIGGRIRIAYVIWVFLGFLISKSIRNIILKQLRMKFKGGLQYVK